MLEIQYLEINHLTEQLKKNEFFISSAGNKIIMKNIFNCSLYKIGNFLRILVFGVILILLWGSPHFLHHSLLQDIFTGWNSNDTVLYFDELNINGKNRRGLDFNLSYVISNVTYKNQKKKEHLKTTPQSYGSQCRHNISLQSIGKEG